MIEIKHRETKEVLYRIDADTLEDADLSDKNLNRADFHNAHLQGANLNNANLRFADLSCAYLSRADLSNADLRYADLRGANLSTADITDANLRSASLNHTNLSYASLGDTLFINCRSLHRAIGLETVKHLGPSALDWRTLRACVTYLPNVFLQGVGYTNEEIENLRAMYRQGIAYYSCFLSYAHLNSEFANRLRTDLLANSVSCWQDTQELRGGDKWTEQINRAIKEHDKLVLICSRQAVYRPQVVREILEAIDTERETGQKKLFPIRLDDHILSPAMMEEAREKVKSGEWRENWVYYVQQYQIPDFSKWKDHDAYQAEFQKLLRDLKNPAKR